MHDLMKAAMKYELKLVFNDLVTLVKSIYLLLIY